MISVEVKNGDVASALRIFNKKVYDSGIMLELKDRMYFKTKAEKKKAKKERQLLLANASKRHNSK